MTALWWDLAGVSTIVLDGDASTSDVDALTRAFTPYRPRSGQPGRMDVGIRPLHLRTRLLGIQGSAGDAILTGQDGERAYLILGRRVCSIPDPLHEMPVAFEYERGFPLHEVAATFLRTGVALSAIRNDAVVVHASAVSLEGRAILVGGWSESGKTEVSLALAEAGAGFISDKWTVVRADDSVCPFPATVGVRRWVLPHLPRLAAALPATSKLQLQAAGLAAHVAAPFQRPFRSPLAREASAQLSRVLDLGDRASLSLEAVRSVYGGPGDIIEPTPLGLVVLLTTVPRDGAGEPTARAIDPALLARRLALAGAFERRSFFSVTDRVRYGGLEGRTSGDAAASAEERVLRERFAGLPAIEVATPFPMDPRRAAELILARLGRS